MNIIAGTCVFILVVIFFTLPTMTSIEAIATITGAGLIAAVLAARDQRRNR